MIAESTLREESRTVKNRHASSAVAAIRRSGIVIPALALFVVLSLASSSFATKANLLNLVDQQASVLIIAAAGTLVVIARGLDLSVGAVYALAAVVSAQLAQHHAVIPSMLIGVGIGAFIGLLNGIAVAVLEINALIATLAMSFVVTGVAALVTSGNAVQLFNHPSYGDLAQTHIFTVNSSTWVAVAVVLVVGAILSQTTSGRHIFAVGGNPNAAALAGVWVAPVRIGTFVLSGAAAALGGLIDSSRVLSAQSSIGGDSLTFTVIASIVVGGTSILGGEGAVWRTVVGVLFLALIANGYSVLGLNPLYQQITLGVLILLAVGVGPTLKLITSATHSLRQMPRQPSSDASG